MDLNFSPQEIAFRDEVRAFLREKLPAGMSDRVRRGDAKLIREDVLAWQRILYQQGWGAPGWPVEFGGTGWSKTQQYLFETECALAYAPMQLAFGLKMVAPVLMRYGSPEQQKRFLPPIVEGRDWWCQGYSEPGAGSDLASLKTRADREGDEYVVNGDKAWNTLGQYADWIFCLVRTDSGAKQQRGISFLLIDMKSRGITVRPTRLLDGSVEVNEIRFENVRVPVDNRVGAENDGWTYAKYLLGHERTNIAAIGNCQRELARLKELARSTARGGRSLLEDPLFSTRVAQVELELAALEITNLRVLFEESRQKAPGPEVSILKIRGTEIQQRISELQVEASGPRALLASFGGTTKGGTGGDAAEEEARHALDSYLNLRKVTIYGGSNEIQRNIIAKTILKI